MQEISLFVPRIIYFSILKYSKIDYAGIDRVDLINYSVIQRVTFKFYALDIGTNNGSGFVPVDGPAKMGLSVNTWGGFREHEHSSSAKSKLITLTRLPS